MATLEERLRLAEAALTKNGFRKLDDIWVAPPRTGDALAMALEKDVERYRFIRDSGLPILGADIGLANLDEIIDGARAALERKNGGA